jgi:hypothetical protein
MLPLFKVGKDSCSKGKVPPPRAPDQVAAEEVPLQQVVINERGEEQQRRKGAGHEGHELGAVAEQRRGELADVLLGRAVARVQPVRACSNADRTPCRIRSNSQTMHACMHGPATL